MTSTEVQSHIAALEATRDKLAAEIEPQVQAIAATKAEIDNLDSAIAALKGETRTPPATSQNGSQPDGKTISEADVRKAHKALVKLTADDENPNPDALNGLFRKGEYAKALDTDSKNKTLDDSLKALVASGKWTLGGKPPAGLRYGPKA